MRQVRPGQNQPCVPISLFVGGYRKNPYELNGSVTVRMSEDRRFAFDEWGYALLKPSP